MYHLQDFQPKQRGAIFDETKQYRYSLWRTWDSRGASLAFILLNPSQANEVDDDPTIRRCMGFARGWGYQSVEIVNLFAYCATKVSTLRKAKDPVGSENDLYIRQAAERADMLLYAWGNWGCLRGRNLEVQSLLQEFNSGCLGLTNRGNPKHPLYLPKQTRIVRYEPSKHCRA